VKKYCVIGKHLPHTLSPEIHSEFGLDYTVCELKDEELQKFATDKDFDGYNVTIPYKKAIIPFLDFVDDTARTVGAVNTVVNIDGLSYGYNTDIDGMDIALKKANIILENKVVMILGSGGTSLTAQYLAKKLNAKKIIVVSRTGEVNYENCYNNTDTNVIINTTPVGMFPNGGYAPVDITRFTNLAGVFDAIYNPLTTSLIAKAREIGLNADNGLTMLVAQAKKSRDYFVGDKAQDSIIEKTVEAITKSHKNIVLVGMPSSGKSVIGLEIAEKTKRNFVDTDKEIEKKMNMDIPQIFEKFGEKYFRELEKQVVSEIASGFGIVISTGGGTVLNKDNREALAQNGYIIWIKRNINKLSTVGRPLSKNIDNLITLAMEREPIYDSISDIAIENNDTITQVVKEIIDNYEKNISNKRC
jgi:shikimate dehydrogenase